MRFWVAEYLIRLLIICVLLAACGGAERRVTYGFYYWRTTFNVAKAEKKAMEALNARRLYVRLADIDMDPQNRAPVPNAPIRATGQPTDTGVVPVYFVVNDMLKRVDSAAIRLLARRMADYTVAKTAQVASGGFKEYQIDCDWTAQTRGKYFYLLRLLQQQRQLKGKTISATLRLHQLKYKLETGVPPVNRVMLMCYNMGIIQQYGNDNALFNLTELKKYAGKNLSSYGMPVDVALPLFKWGVVFRNGRYSGLLKGNNMPDTARSDLWHKQANGMWLLKRNMPEAALLAGDEVRIENAGAAELEGLTRYLDGVLPRSPLNVVYFDLDTANINYYGYKTLKAVGSHLR